MTCQECHVPDRLSRPAATSNEMTRRLFVAPIDEEDMADMTKATAPNRRFRRPMTRFMACGLLACALAVAVAGSHSTLLASSPRASVTAPLPPSAEGVSPATVISYSAIVDRVQPGVVTVQVEKREAAGGVQHV